jgi:hypothetical protein
MLTGQRWNVATVRGIPLYVSTSWVWIAGLYVWSGYADLASLGPAVVSSFEAIVLAVVAALVLTSGKGQAPPRLLSPSYDLARPGLASPRMRGAPEKGSLR